MKERIAAVSGSHKGLGFEIARRLSEKPDLWVIVTARSLATANEAREKLRSLGLEVDVQELDVTNDESVKSFAEWVEARYGRLDILVNNAGVNPYHSEEEASVLTAKPQILLETINTNAAGMLRLSQALIPIMKRNDYGRIVNVSTEMSCLNLIGKDHYPAAPSYRASKVVMNALALLMAKELVGTNILINSYSPGWMKTDIGGPDAPYTVEEGAETAVYLATLPDGGPSGAFFAEMRKFGGPFALPW